MKTAACEVVIDTNIVLDLFVFEDPASVALQTQVESGALRWIATAQMRDELQRVLGYPQIASRLVARCVIADQVLARFDQYVRIVEVPARGPLTCADADDQKFIDLAAARQCLLLSKDAEVLALAKRMSAIGAIVSATL